MKLYDLVVEGRGIFYYMNKIRPLPYNVSVGIDIMDRAFLGLHGGRELSPFVKSTLRGRGINEETIRELAGLTYGLFGRKWEKSYNVLTADLPLESYNLITTETITDEGETSSNTAHESENTDTTDVTGYNTDDYVPEDRQGREGSETSTHEGQTSNTREKTTQVKGNIDNPTNNRIKVLEYLKNDLIYGIMFTDVSQLLGLLIY